MIVFLTYLNTPQFIHFDSSNFSMISLKTCTHTHTNTLKTHFYLQNLAHFFGLSIICLMCNIILCTFYFSLNYIILNEKKTAQCCNIHMSLFLFVFLYPYAHKFPSCLLLFNVIQLNILVDFLLLLLLLYINEN